MHSKTFAQCRITVASDGLQTVNEVYVVTLLRHIERVPSELSGANMHMGIQRGEVALELRLLC